MSPTEISTRPATNMDEPFLRCLFHIVRAPEFAPARLSPEQLDALLNQQYDAMRSYYADVFPETEYVILEHAGSPVGYEAVRATDELHLIDIALLPDYRNQGVGTARLRRLQTLAEEHETSLLLAVEVFNPARNLYVRLGFVVEEQQGIYEQMRWTPPTRKP